MSGFISGRGSRLTTKRLVLVLGICAAVCALMVIVAPQLGIVMTKDGRAIEWLGFDSLDPTTFTIDSVLPDAKRRAEVWRKGLRRAVSLERLTHKRRGSTGRARAKRSA